MGATVIGVSNDGIDALKRFSVEACRDKFAVASDPEAKVIRAYDAQLAARPGMADRISYVIDRNGSVAFVHAGADPTAHVAQTLQAVERLAGAASKR
jgi:peroxiredoxin